MADTHDDDTSPWPPRSEEPPPATPPEPTAAPAAPPLPPGPASVPAPPTAPPASSATSAPSPATTGWIPPAPAKSPAPARSGGWDGARIAGIILVLVGVFLLLRRFVPLDSELLLPVVAIVIGGALVLGALRPRGRNG